MRAFFRTLMLILIVTSIPKTAIASKTTIHEYSKGVDYSCVETITTAYGKTYITRSDCEASAQKGAEHCWVQDKSPLKGTSSPATHLDIKYIKSFTEPTVKSVWISRMGAYYQLEYFTTHPALKVLVINSLSSYIEKDVISGVVAKVPQSTRIYLPFNYASEFPDRDNVKSLDKCFIKEWKAQLTSVEFTLDEDFMQDLGVKIFNIMHNDEVIEPENGKYTIKGLTPSSNVSVAITFIDSYGDDQVVYNYLPTKSVEFEVSNVTQSTAKIKMKGFEGDESTGAFLDCAFSQDDRPDAQYYSAERNGDEIVVRNLNAGKTHGLRPHLKYENGEYALSSEFLAKTLPVSPQAKLLESKQTSAKLKLSFQQGDANISRVSLDGRDIDMSKFKNGECDYELTDIFFNNESREIFFDVYSEGFLGTTYERYKIKFSLKPLTQSINVGKSPTSLRIEGTWTHGDAEITGQYITCNNQRYEGGTAIITGLIPNTEYKVSYTITGSTFGSLTKTQSYTTLPLEMEIPTVTPINPTTANVVSMTNLNDYETNVGFQWRKYDAPASLPNSEGSGFIYEGAVQGTLKNLQSTFYYNVRAFYKSSEDKYYYSDWVTFDPSDFSYCEPAVHTYPVDTPGANSANVRGCVLQGTDAIKWQGFEYWISGMASSVQMKAPDKNVTRVPSASADGHVMTATLTGLKGGSVYSVRSLVKTDSGDFYGEEQTFTTPGTGGVEGVDEDGNAKEVIGYYDMFGRRYTVPQRGLNIVLYSDGTSEKMINRE